MIPAYGILSQDTHRPEPIDEALAREVDNIVESARRHLL